MDTLLTAVLTLLQDVIAAIALTMGVIYAVEFVIGRPERKDRRGRAMVYSNVWFFAAISTLSAGGWFSH